MSDLGWTEVWTRQGSEPDLLQWLGDGYHKNARQRQKHHSLSHSGAITVMNVDGIDGNPFTTHKFT